MPMPGLPKRVRPRTCVRCIRLRSKLRDKLWHKADVPRCLRSAFGG
jgi:hypothetical protein